MKTSRRLAVFYSQILAGTALAALAACSDSKAPENATAATATSKYAMPADPAAGISVVDAKKAVPKGDVVVFGRVRELVPGLAAFTLTDSSLAYCGEKGECGCPTPWDYCCEQSETIASHSMSVVVKEKGEAVVLKKIPELRNCDLVAVVGTLVKEKGDVILEAKSWYRRDRPKLPADIKFPE